MPKSKRPGQPKWIIEEPASPWSNTVSSPDGLLLASASTGADNTVKLWDVGKGEFLRSLGKDTSEVRSMAYSPDGSILATGTLGRRFRPVEMQAGRTHGPSGISGLQSGRPAVGHGGAGPDLGC